MAQILSNVIWKQIHKVLNDCPFLLVLNRILKFAQTLDVVPLLTQRVRHTGMQLTFVLIWQKKSVPTLKLCLLPWHQTAITTLVLVWRQIQGPMDLPVELQRLVRHSSVSNISVMLLLLFSFFRFLFLLMRTRLLT